MEAILAVCPTGWRTLLQSGEVSADEFDLRVHRLVELAQCEVKARVENRVYPHRPTYELS